MSTLQLIEAAGTPVGGATLRILAAASTPVGGATTLRVLNAAGTPLSATTTLRVLNAAGVGSNAAIASMTAPPVVDPLTLVTLDASASVGTITSITQTAGTPTVTLTGTGASRTFTAPIINATDATDLTFRVTVTGGGTDDVIVAVRPHTTWGRPVGDTYSDTYSDAYSSGAALVQVVMYGRDPATALPVGSVAGWGAQLAAVDFTTQVPVGSFVPDATGALTSLQGGGPGYIAYQGIIATTPEGQAGAEYRYPARTMSVTRDGLDIWLHREDVPATVSPTRAPTANIVDPAIGVTWINTYAENFDTPIALGGFTNATSGDQGAINPACPAYAPYGASFKMKSVSSDTSGNATYNAPKTTSVANSIYDIWCHYDASTARAVGGAIKPWLVNGQGVDQNFMTYGRVAWRERWTGIVGDPLDYGHAALMINSNAWPTNGELDFTEGPPGSPVGGFFHPAQATNATAVVTIPGAPSPLNWHDCVIEWFPWQTGARTRWFLDGALVYDRTDRVAVAPMTLGWLIQVGSNNTLPATTSEAHYQVEYISMWRES